MVCITRSSGTMGIPKTMAVPHAGMQRIICRTLDTVVPDLLSPPSFLSLYSLGVRSAYMRVLGS